MPLIESLEKRQLLSAVIVSSKAPPRRLAELPVKIAATEGSPFSGAVATFTDTASSTYTATVVWGDGSSSDGTIAPGASGGSEVDASHTYTRPRVLFATVKLFAADGRRATVFSVARVADAALTAAGDDFGGVRNALFSGPVATFTDADPNATATFPATETASINWGDGTASPGEITQDTPGGPFMVSGKHFYAAAKSYAVTTRIHDRFGMASAIATATATIVPPFPVLTPSLIGDYVGKVKAAGILGITGSHDFEVDITGQMIDSLTGTVKLDGATVVSGTLMAGQVNGVTAGLLSNGNFIFEQVGSDYDVTISGHVSLDGKTITSGYIDASASALPVRIKGAFSLTLQ